MTDLSLVQAIASGELLATIDDIEYVAVRAVFERGGDGTTGYYCTEAEWPHTHAGQLTARDTTIQRLQAEIDRLQAELAAHTVPPTVAAAATGMERSPERLRCPDCDRTFVKDKSLQMHRQRAHLGMQAGPRKQGTQAEVPPIEEAPAARPLLQILPDDPTWHCAECTSNAHGPFARSLHRPDLCIRCAQLAPPATTAAEPAAIAA